MASQQPPGDSKPSIRASQQPPGDSKPSILASQQVPPDSQTIDISFETCVNGFTQPAGDFET